MPIDRVGIGPVRPCMLMCERTSVSPLRVSAWNAHREHIRVICTWYIRLLLQPEVSVHTCVTSARPSYVRVHWKELLPDIRLFLTRCHYRFTLTFCSARAWKRNPKVMKLSCRESYIQLSLNCTFHTESNKKNLRKKFSQKFWIDDSVNISMYLNVHQKHIYSTFFIFFFNFKFWKSKENSVLENILCFRQHFYSPTDKQQHASLLLIVLLYGYSSNSQFSIVQLHWRASIYF